MTVDDRLVIDLTDVLAIQVQCKSCGTAITYSPEKWEPREMMCPGCTQTWWFTGNPALIALQQFANLWRAIVGREQSKSHDLALPVKIRLQVPRQSGPAPSPARAN